MLFVKLTHIIDGGKLSIQYTYLDKSVTFLIGGLITKVRKELLLKPNMFKPLVDYINSKNLGGQLLNSLIEFDNSVIVALTTNDYSSSLRHVRDIMNMLDVDDVSKFMARYSGINPPQNLKDVFIEEAGSTLRKELTYLRKEYYDLQYLILVFKLIIGPWATLGRMNLPGLHKSSIELSLVRIFSDTKPFQSRAYDRLNSYISKMLDNTPRDKLNVIMVNKAMSVEDMPDWMFGLLGTRRFAISDIMSDNTGLNIVTAMFNFIHTVTVDSPSSSGRITDKKPTSGDSGQLSIMESTHIQTDMTAGRIEECDIHLSDVHKLMNHLGLKDKRYLDVVLNEVKPFRTTVNVPDRNRIVVGWIMNIIMSYKMVQRCSNDSLFNALIVSHIWCLDRGLDNIAMMLLSFDDTSNLYSQSPTVKNKIPEDIADTLTKVVFPNSYITKTRNNETVNDRYVSDIKNLAKMYGDRTALYMLPTTLLKGRGKHVQCLPNLKPEIGRLMIEIEEAR